MSKRMTYFATLVPDNIHIKEVSVITGSQGRRPNNASAMPASSAYDLCVISEPPSYDAIEFGSIA